MRTLHERYQKYLDPADTLFAANYLLGYFGSSIDAPHLMRRQKVEELKLKNLWDKDSFASSFATSITINPKELDFGVNVYAVGAAVDGRRKKPAYECLLELTTTGGVAGGWGAQDFVVTHTKKHRSCGLVKGQVPPDEFVLGIIRMGTPVLNNAPLTRHLAIDKIGGEFANQHILYAKALVPTQPFGSLLRGGKLIALLAASNELRDFYNQCYERHIAIFYTTSLYGTSKTNSQYDQLDRFIKLIGDTPGKLPLRMKDPQKKQLINWMDERGISRYQFIFNGTSKADRSHAAIVDFVSHCLRKHTGDKNIRQIRKLFKDEMFAWKNGLTERKKVYFSSYGFDDWKDIIVESEPVSKPEYDLENLFNYWKKKVLKKEWGLRKKSWLEDDIQLEYQLINQQLKDPDFVQVR